jgi:hypothetical protein
MHITEKEKAILRQLAEKVAEVAALPVHKKQSDLRKTNNLSDYGRHKWFCTLSDGSFDENFNQLFRFAKA